MLGLALLWVAAIARAQDASSPSASLAPAATAVLSTDTDAGTALFDEETVQLTDGVVNTLLDNAALGDHASLFAFADSDVPESTRRRRVRRSAKCKTSPGDYLWPTDTVLDQFDKLLGGALDPIKPLASVCYPKSQYDDYDAAECATVTANWTDGALHYDDPGSMMNPLYEGLSCPPGTNVSALGNCTQGGFSSYSVRISNVAQIQLAVNFARALNLRLVVRNTGHDYNARSTGKYALSLWTHNLKTIKYLPNYRSSTYSGKAFKIGAGVQGFELYQAADKYGVSAISGICPTVGVAGGYSAGGGHSPLMQLFGMGADQVVALEVVTASGRFVSATPTVNSDLYWALLGGGGGTFGIVTSAVVKVHEKVAVTTSVFNFSSAGVGADRFWEGMRFFWDQIPVYNAAKTYSWFSIRKDTAGGIYSFYVTPFFAANMTVAEFESLTKPLFDKLKALNISYQIETKHYDIFYPAFEATFGLFDFHIGGYAVTPGNRILPKENWADPSLNNKTFTAVRNAVDIAFSVSGYHQAPANPAKILNSVNPAFRHEASMLVLTSFIADMTPSGIAAANHKLTYDIIGPLRALTPTGGAYGNEADISEPGWQQAFWGDNYPRLLDIKRKWDPSDLFYVWHGVGSEDWYVDDGDRGVQTQDGKLCRV